MQLDDDVGARLSIIALSDMLIKHILLSNNVHKDDVISNIF